MWRSLVAHLTGGQGVAGSNPVIPTKCLGLTRDGGSGPSSFFRRGGSSDPPCNGLRNSLETQLRAELHLARILRAEDTSEVRGTEDATRDVEVHRVERVEDFPPQLQLTRPGHIP